jgi:hypothetical protein
VVIRINLPVLFFSGGVALATALGFGLWSAPPLRHHLRSNSYLLGAESPLIRSRTLSKICD